MKKKHLFALIGFLLLAVLALIFFAPRANDGVRKRIVSGERGTDASSASESPSTASVPPPLDPQKAKLLALLEKNDASVSFYGRVIDDDGKPVQGAAVAFSIVRSGSFFPNLGMPANDSGQIETDANGLFRILNRKGVTLGIKQIAKSGYHEPKGNGIKSFDFGDSPEPHIADANAPVTYLLLKDGPKKILVGNERLKLAWNTGSVRIPLAKESNEFIVLNLKRGPEWDARKPSQKFDWNVEIALENGQVQKIAEGAAPFAPVGDYKDNVEVGYRKADPLWAFGCRQSIAFKSASGRYGIVDLSIYADRADGDMTGRIQSRMNTSGGRAID